MEAVVPSQLEVLTGDLASSSAIHPPVCLCGSPEMQYSTHPRAPFQDVGPVNVLRPIIGSWGCITGNGLRIAYQGVPGAYGEAAAHKAVPGASIYVQHPQFADVFEVRRLDQCTLCSAQLFDFATRS